jgi:hypothetical protein
VVQKGAFSFDCLPERLRLTLIRSSFYGYDRGVKLDPSDPQMDTDQGRHDFRILILSGQKLDPAFLDRASEVFLEPFTLIRES